MLGIDDLERQLANLLCPVGDKLSELLDALRDAVLRLAKPLRSRMPLPVLQGLATGNFGKRNKSLGEDVIGIASSARYLLYDRHALLRFLGPDYRRSLGTTLSGSMSSDCSMVMGTYAKRLDVPEWISPSESVARFWSDRDRHQVKSSWYHTSSSDDRAQPLAIRDDLPSWRRISSANWRIWST